MSEERESGGIPTFEWRTAPSHLRTQRQLAAEGMRPNGQDIAGKIPFRRRGREHTAYLYDINLAAAKRQPTPAQLAALEKATREHQLRAAERHGVDRGEFEHDMDSGPAWAESSAPSTAPVNAFAGLGGNAFAAVAREGMER
ncbi:RRQRL motif-containing zinc-binding protein [Nocardia brasiliensis]|uniref:RRQRL motif-containing zinc-binding protein n=1 Tax=Nocardia brasiliensis TaxID=37326 RepID=UPI002453BF63|nr:RRQRL motif-containing zinc-binding protein [Nocardia brasiliensis]